MAFRPKFKKSKCRKCKYRGSGVMTETNKRKSVYRHYCNYCGHTGQTCLRKNKETGEIYDARGNDFDNCLLYERKID